MGVQALHHHDDTENDVGHRAFKVLATCGVFEPGFRGGGIVRAVVQTVDTISADVDLALVTRDHDLGRSAAYPGLSGRWSARHASRVFYLNPASPRQWLRLYRDLRGVSFDLLSASSLFSAYTTVSVAAARLGLIRCQSILISPHGEFSPGALSLKARKKALFLKVWGPFLRRAGVLWHATNDREAVEIRTVFPWARTIVNHNQTSLPAEPITPTQPVDPTARLVFVGRVSAKKNLEMTLRALLDMSLPVIFDIYGPLEDAQYWKRCEALIDRMPPHVRVRYRGAPPADTEMYRIFAGYDAFVFPTLGENFAYVIVESLAASCPVICSAETPWNRVLGNGGGALVPDLSAGSLTAELDRIAAMTPDERLRMKLAAGDAYRVWRGGVDNTNLFDRVRQADSPIAAGQR